MTAFDSNKQSFRCFVVFLGGQDDETLAGILLSSGCVLIGLRGRASTGVQSGHSAMNMSSRCSLAFRSAEAWCRGMNEADCGR